MKQIRTFISYQNLTKFGKTKQNKTKQKQNKTKQNKQNKTKQSFVDVSVFLWCLMFVGCCFSKPENKYGTYVSVNKHGNVA